MAGVRACNRCRVTGDSHKLVVDDCRFMIMVERSENNIQPDNNKGG